MTVPDNMRSWMHGREVADDELEERLDSQARVLANHSEKLTGLDDRLIAAESYLNEIWERLGDPTPDPDPGDDYEIVTVGPGDPWPEPREGVRIEALPGRHRPIHWDNEDFGTIGDGSPVVFFRGGAYIEPGDLHATPCVRLRHVRGITFKSLLLEGGLWGVRARTIEDCAFIGTRVNGSGQEGMQFDNNSKRVDIFGCEITGTGARPGNDSNGLPYAAYGEGIYIGNGDHPDVCEDFFVSGCHISNTRGEGFDNKAGTLRTRIKDCVFVDCKPYNSGVIVDHIGGGYSDDPNNFIVENVVIHRPDDWSPYADANGVKVSSSATLRNVVVHAGPGTDRAIFAEVQDNDMRNGNGRVIVDNCKAIGNFRVAAYHRIGGRAKVISTNNEHNGNEPIWKIEEPNG